MTRHNPAQAQASDVIDRRPAAMIDTFKLFGLQRTCTNLLLRALCGSYGVASIEVGYEWKHGRIGPAAGTGAAIVCSVKDPYAWLASMYRFSRTSGDQDGCPFFEMSWDFSEFLRRPHYDWPHPVRRWNALTAHYVDWVAEHPEQGFLVLSERLMKLESQARAIREIGDHFGWIGQPATFSERIAHDADPDGLRRWISTTTSRNDTSRSSPQRTCNSSAARSTGHWRGGSVTRRQPDRG